MRLSEVCIERPVLATVMSLVILLFGIISFGRLPNRELPDVDAPIVSVTTIYPGAAPEVVETSVTQPLEDQIIGIEGVRHVTSSSREQVSQISIEFELSRDVEAAANDVRDRVARARRALPEEVEEPVVAKQDADARPIMWLAMSGEGYSQIQLSKIADTRVKDRLGKLGGVATVLVGGERRYSMRLWIDQAQLTARGLTIADVVSALDRENVDIPSGRVESTDVEFTVRSLGELRTVAAYEDLIVATVSGDPVRLRDVARVEVGPEDERKLVRFNGVTALGLGVVKQSKSNTLDVAGGVRRELDRLNVELPPGVSIHIAWDASSYIERSIRDVTQTIFEAVVLVVLVIYIFLRTARATIIPAIAIPVSIVGSFTLLYVTGFTINTLTLMGMTLAIGLVVDDAIVVLENVTRWVEEGTPPMEAARQGMKEISFAVVASTVAAVAVFLPLTFLQDTTGRLFREFAVTVGAALLISGFVALTLSPALCARVLRARPKESGVKARLAGSFDALSRGYGRWLTPVVNHPLPVVGLGALWVTLGVGLYLGGALEEELIPNSDRGTVLAITRAPEGATIEYTDRYQKQAEEILLQDPDVARVFSVVALGIGTPGVVNEGFLWVSLVPRDERDRHQREVVDGLRPKLSKVPGVRAFPFSPSPLRGFSKPVSLVIQGPDLGELHRLAQGVVERLEATPGFASVESNLYLNKPQLEVVIDRERASDLGVSARDIASTLQILLGGLDVSSFKLDGETYDVIAQLPRFDRSSPQDLVDLYVHGRDGRLVSLSQVVQARQTIAPRALPHYDRLRSVTVSARLEDLATGAALEQVRAIAEEEISPAGGYRFTFSGDSERFFEAGDALIFAYALAVLVVYLVLAAQFESFVDPLTILVAVALSFTGALVALIVAGDTLNLFSKIGLVMLVGLVTKNSILIVEFANQLRERGLSLVEATVQAARTRFRPILMTALATMAGISPIALGLGVGGESRAPLGVAVVGGMFFSTLLTFFVVPATYVAVARLRSTSLRRLPSAEAGQRPLAAGGR
ncbi:MAG: efflux RND transporter permease subunit [Myxococcota bacterium]